MSSFGRRQDFRAAKHRVVPGRFAVDSVPKNLDYADDPNEDGLILVDGAQIGGTYICGDGTWASHGPAGFSFKHPDRAAAIAAQVRAYVIDPSGHDRAVADGLAEEAAEQAERDAKERSRREQRAAERRRERLGDDEPGPAVLTVPAYHAFYADQAEVHAVGEWLSANGIENASAVADIRVEQRATRRAIVFQAPRWWAGGRNAETETYVATLTADPPRIDTPPRPDLHALCEEHWPARFPLIDCGQTTACSSCTSSARPRQPGEDFASVLEPWPCQVLTDAVANPPAQRVTA